ncbi:hypothetical protein LR948_00960 [Roseivivax sp. GX 12232]|uniref:hypothetical protein n=1 Tax=Roseivivax sp. GX 12232 TaxID=2900547 RepID=UPI001E3F9625|nr:hypothetical protein [Roseivivax sp. GX 12232]MCE0503914.1 hypothetical protein [Roseivivax sp. GX 12232]
MLIETRPIDDGLAVLTVSGRLARASDLPRLLETCDALTALGRIGQVLDLSLLKRVSFEGLASLVELAARRPQIILCYAALPDGPLRMLRRSGLDRGLRILPSLEAALGTPELRRVSLNATRTVLFPPPVAGGGSALLLDLCGTPVIDHMLAALGKYGLSDLVVDAKGEAEAIRSRLGPGSPPGMRLQFCGARPREAERYPSTGNILKNLQEDQAAFQSDLLVCEAPIVGVPDMQAMMRAHRTSRALATAAIVSTTPPDKGDQPLGLTIYSPEAIDRLPADSGSVTWHTPINARTSLDQSIATFQVPSNAIRIDSWQALFRATAECLAGCTEVPPTGRRIGPGLWREEDAEQHRQAQIHGPCHIGAGARIDAGACLKGVTAIGAGARIESATLLQDCLVLPGAEVRQGTWAKGQVIGPNGFCDLHFANDLAVPDTLNAASPVHEDPPQPIPIRRRA